MLMIIATVSALLMLWVLFRWRQIAKCANHTNAPSENLCALLSEARKLAGLTRDVRLRITPTAMSPAVCGLFRPVILLPQSLIEKLTARQIRAVLLHELIHLRRQDVWVNCAQTLLQIVYWWHPLLWFANARVRRVREEAVDDAVMCALNSEAEIYAPTLLEVAKLAFARPLASLGLVGILESRSVLRHRIERLLNFTTPRRAGVSVVSLACLAAFTALAVPMGEPPAQPRPAGADELATETLIPYRAKVDADVFARNIQARANGTMHGTNDDLNDILASIMDGFGVDCTGERTIQFNRATGEVTARNTSEALGVLDEVVRELNLKGGEFVLRPPQGLKQVLLEGQFYLMKSTDVTKLSLASSSAHREEGLSPWVELSPADLTNIRQQFNDLGIKAETSPRIQTSHGVTAEMFFGDATNHLNWECVPYVHNRAINFTVLARTSGEFAPSGKGWPDIAGHTNCAIFTRMNLPDGGTGLLRAQQAGADKELVVLLTAKIVEPNSTRNSQTIGHSIQNDTNKVASAPGSTADIKTLVEEGKLFYQSGKTEDAIMRFKMVLEKDPKNQAALYYVGLLNQLKEYQLKDGAQVNHGQNLKDPPAGARAMNVPGPDSPPNNPRTTLVPPNLYARTNQVFTSAARQKLYEKLSKITFDKVSFNDATMREVIEELSKITARRDIDQEGINFILNRTQPKGASAPGAPPAFDPSTGQPIPPAQSDVDLASVKVNLVNLKNVRLLDVLETITKSADHALTYSILDYGIEFSLKGPEFLQLHTRTFRVDPNTFYRNLQNTGTFSFVPTNAPASGTNQARGLRFVTGANSTTEIQLAVVGFFTSVGVNLSSPKSIFFNERQGTLTVRATDDDLELIEQAINNLNMAPPEVTVKARFLEIDPAMLASVFTNYSPAGTNTVMGILTEPAMKAMLKSLTAKDTKALINEGEVTTLSGRQANFQIVDVQTVVSGLTASVTNNSTRYDYQMTNMTFGSTLDVVPYVGADGYTIQLTVTPKITEFLSYENPKEYVKYDEKLKHAQLPLLKYRNRQMTTSAIVWDGQTLVLGNLSDEEIIAKPDGSTIRQTSSNKKKKKLIILITPTIIDPSGNRLHNENAVTPGTNVRYVSGGPN